MAVPDPKIPPSPVPSPWPFWLWAILVVVVVVVLLWVIRSCERSALRTRPALASDFYVDPTNGVNDFANIASPGIGHPLRSINYALAHSAPNVSGDNIILRAGTYTYPLENANGTAMINFGHTNSGVTLKVYWTPTNNEEAWLASTSSPYCLQLFSAQGVDRAQQRWDHTHFVHHVVVDGSGNDSVLATESNHLGRHMHFLGPDTSRLIMVRMATNITLRYLDLSTNSVNDHIKFVSNLPDNKGGENGSSTGQYYGTNDFTGPKNCLVEYCDIHDGGDYGIKVTGWDCHDIIIRHCFIHDAGGHGSDNYGANVSGSGYGFFYKNVANPVFPDRNDPVAHSWITDNSVTNGETVHNITWDHCVFSNNYNSGLQFTVCYSNTVTNCRFYTNGFGKPQSAANLSFGSFAWGNYASNCVLMCSQTYGVLIDNWAVSNTVDQALVLMQGGGATIGMRISGTSSWCKVINSTIINHGDGGDPGLQITGYPTNVCLTNNLLYNDGDAFSAAWTMVQGATCLSDFNLTWNPKMATAWPYYDGGFKTVEQWRLTYGLENNGRSLEPMIGDPASNNLAIQFWSPLIDGGIPAGRDIGFEQFAPPPPPKDAIPGLIFQ